MTCGDVEQLLDAFLDRELPSPKLLDVARHASACAACDGTLRQFSTLGDLLSSTVAADVAALDLSAVWPGVAKTVARETARRRWRHRARVLPAWAVTFATAALLAVYLQPSQSWLGRRAAQVVRGAPGRMLPHQPVIERLDGKHVTVRSEPKAGATMIWVNHPTGDMPR